jgi:hypothetical protein
MRSILFSAHFNQDKNPERVAFLEALLERLPQDVGILAFDLSGTVEASFPVVTGHNPKPSVPRDAKAKLKARLAELLGDSAGDVLRHAIGEAEALGSNPNRLLAAFLDRIERFVRTVEFEEPVHCYLWNQFNAFHRFAEAWLRRRGTAVGFFHDGVLPGSIAIDFDGEMGASWVTNRPDLLNSVPVSDADLDSARRFLAWSRDEGISRHKQAEKILVAESLEIAGFAGKPMIFYAGQNDWHAGIQPENPDRPLHSPHYRGSAEPLADLDRIAKERDWVVVYKPHPLDRDRYVFLRAGDYERVLIISSTDTNVCLDLCSVFVTIASQTCYMAALRDKPIVMLGRNQMIGKGLTYDVADIRDLEPLLVRAMEDPLAASRATELARHAAQLEKVYLYDYGLFDNDFYKRGATEAAHLITYAIGRSAEEVIAGLIRSAKGEPLAIDVDPDHDVISSAAEDPVAVPQ